MPKYILHYFNINSRASIPRAILSYVKADWENHLITHEDWPKYKTSGLCEFEQLPVLEVDGKKYCESNAIHMYLAEKYNLMGKNPEENYQIANLLMTLDDFYAVAINYFKCTDESKKEEFQKKSEEKLKFFIDKFEKRYVGLGKHKYFLGDKFTLADIFLTCVLIDNINAIKMKECPFKEIAPNLGKLIDRVKENELKEYFEKYYIKL